MGFAELLERSRQAAPATAVDTPEATNCCAQSRRIVYRCLTCMQWEETYSSEVRRANKIALSWGLRRFTGDPMEAQDEDVRAAPWGPRQLWVPTEFKENEREANEEIESMIAVGPAPAAASPLGAAAAQGAAPPPAPALARVSDGSLPAPAGDGVAAAASSRGRAALEGYLRAAPTATASPAAAPQAAQQAACASGQEQVPLELQQAFPGARLVFVPMGSPQGARRTEAAAVKPAAPEPARTDGLRAELQRAFPGAELVLAPIPGES